jgi:hypothetical protein
MCADLAAPVAGGLRRSEATPPLAVSLICDVLGSHGSRVRHRASSGEPASGLAFTAPAIGDGATSIWCHRL